MATVNFPFTGMLGGQEVVFTAEFDCDADDVDLLQVIKIVKNGEVMFDLEELTTKEREESKHLMIQYTLAGDRACHANPRIWPRVCERQKTELEEKLAMSRFRRIA